MIKIREVHSYEKELIKEIVKVHMKSFEGFFLTFMGSGFLFHMYCSYCEHSLSGLIVAEEENIPLGFLAYSGDMSGLYKYMIKKKIIAFAWYSFCAFLRKPSVFARLFRAFMKPKESKREERYVELASIGVNPDSKSKGIGSLLIAELKALVDWNRYKYISLETDAINNTAANNFYIKNEFVFETCFETHEGRKMNEYRFYPRAYD